MPCPCKVQGSARRRLHRRPRAAMLAANTAPALLPLVADSTHALPAMDAVTRGECSLRQALVDQLVDQ
eukprot:9334691-Alexandrium_andersonii.AAC.1